MSNSNSKILNKNKNLEKFEKEHKITSDDIVYDDFEFAF